ncbi:hypothetical protein BX666DRAFT_939394 [Dichotomocladium elegans]|nr:hypothetical protein BX666DRAFT_939394 [Dichotomocladium elegans]
MNDGSSEDYPFDYRTSNQRFQERLLAAQQNTIEQQIEESIESRRENEEEESSIPLAAQRESLRAEVLIMEKEVETLRKELAKWRARREREASIKNMTPEERAAALEREEQEQKEGDNVMDMFDESVIFDYLISAGSAPMPANAADLSATDFTKPHEEMRAVAMQKPEALEQRKYAHFNLTKMSNEIDKSGRKDEKGRG